ncbi:hypothetical protein C8F04DRAFT_1267080 [Mycena alexandri]|uniref:Uncharacterized protein n=1 Tax=Mycena alexandri TaxID=1745969 RepID=A0AAD6WXU2_9AGAR|nr:hypothetical protein C8F04DRAFT_1267080 [Mycena alexandri]
MVEDLHTPLLPTHKHARALFPKSSSPSGIPARCTRPAPPTPVVLETDGIEVPECESLVHLDGVSSRSLSLGLPHAPPPTLATCVAAHPPSHLRILEDGREVQMLREWRSEFGLQSVQKNTDRLRRATM